MSETEILDRVAAIADPIRARMLALLELQELTVSELMAVLQLPQSTVSRHLKTLGDHGWVEKREDGPRHFYRMGTTELRAADRRLWTILREQLDDTWSDQDAQRLEAVLLERSVRSVEFFSATGAGWDQVRQELYGERFDLLAFLGLLDPSWTVGDLGSGTGQLAAQVAPFVDRVIAVDSSAAMLRAARRRLKGLSNVTVRRGDIEQLPIDDSELDLALLFLVVQYASDPPRVLAECARVLRPGGRLLLLDARPHRHEQLRQRMGHVWLGFDHRQIKSWLSGAGFDSVAVRALPADARASGPSLFVASGVVPSHDRKRRLRSATVAAATGIRSR